MHFPTRTFSVFAALALLAVTAMPARAATPEEAGRAVLERYAKAVVTLKLAVKTRMSFNGQDRNEETKSETIGTVVDASGLTAISLSAIDPSKTVDAMAAQQSRRSGTKVDVKVDSEVTDVDIVLADGSELPASVALRDKDLDLALVMPSTKPAHELEHVDLSGNAVPQMLEQMVAIYRLGKMANRTPTGSIERINAVIAGPRPYYVLGAGQGSSGIGSPVFNLDGAIVGLILLRAVPPEDDGNIGTMFNGSTGMGLLPITVPVSQLRDSVAQALEAAAGK